MTSASSLSTNKVMVDDEVADRMQKLSVLHKELSEKMIKLKHEKEHLQAEFVRLSEEAKEKYGTDDLDSLRAELIRRRESNTKAVLEFEKNLEEIQEALRKLEK